MAYISRIIEKKLREGARGYPVLALTGPRQSGKSTLTKKVFPRKPYVTLEDTDNRAFAISDPRRFLEKFPKGAIIDEIQRAPDLFSYIQGIVDQKKSPGLFILTGSQNFLLLEKITQSLAGRVRLLTLHPFGMAEIIGKKPPRSFEETLFKGFYPPLYDRDLSPREWYMDYIQTYIERDVRQIINVTDLHVFQKFLGLCAARTGQILNTTSLGADCGVSYNTINAWLGILEASYLILRLEPHHENFSKRLIKSPKLYFMDTGLVCSLLRIRSAEDLIDHPMRGAIFESYVISELIKHQSNRGVRPNVYFWRDKTGHEIDALIDQGKKLVPIEIKSGKTISNDFFNNLDYWRRLAKDKSGTPFLVYGGDDNHNRSGGRVVGWASVDAVLRES